MSTADEFESILQWYPELVLISKSTATWNGFLNIQRKVNIFSAVRIKIKLSVPNYPSLDDTKIEIKSTSFLFSPQFYAKVDDLIKKASSVSSFLKQLQLFITDYVDEKNAEEITYSTAIDIINELRDTFSIESDVEIFFKENLDFIKLHYQGINMLMKKDNICLNSWKIISSDLPKLQSDSFENNIDSLIEARQKFKTQIELLKPLWKQLHHIDNNCYIMDPAEPKPYHLYRRIYITQSLSILITLHSMNPTDIPHIQFLGSDIEVDAIRSILSDNLSKWDAEINILNNLQNVLEVVKFPTKPDEISNNVGDCIVDDDECCICFSMELEDEKFPTKACNNRKCRRIFHFNCLLQWLQAVAGNQVVFDTIHGKCPNCEETISCPVNK
ncbi:E3 ubiquitin-protein ligase FANCL [Prorops nasuta]|uniref:E3 ubiquitin-protein ligase FANCL n=1 Tax=Prorops nasuta TaxID=863751 RepID=UPI0034CE4D5E